MNRGQRDEPGALVARDRRLPRGRRPCAAFFDGVPIGRVVINRGRAGQSLDRAGDDVGFGRVKVAARRVGAQRPSRIAELFPRREAQGVSQDGADVPAMADCGLRIADRWRIVGCVGPRVERVLARTGERSKRVGLRRPVEIAEGTGEAVEVVLGPVVIGVDGPDRAVRTWCRFPSPPCAG